MLAAGIVTYATAFGGVTHQIARTNDTAQFTVRLRLVKLWKRD